MSRTDMQGARVSAATVLSSGKYASSEWASDHQALFSDDTPKPPTVDAAVEDGTRATTFSGEGSSIKLSAVAHTANPHREKSDNTGNIWRKSGNENAAYDQKLFRKLKSGSSGWNDMRKRQRDLVVDFQGAKFDAKNLSHADLSHARLRGASFKKADLFDADLRHADLSECDLREAGLEKADLGGADLSGANLWRANLSHARLNGVKVCSATVLDSGKKATPEWAERHDAVFVQ